MIGIYVNPFDQKCLDVFYRLAEKFNNRGILFEKCDKALNKNYSLLIVIGGDGTVLSVAAKAADLQIPVLPLNEGRLGFLSAYESNETDTLVQDVFLNNFDIEKRTVLKAEIDGKCLYALNEINVQREGGADFSGRTISVSLSLSGEKCYDFRGDGLIISTPTGSTAYSLSAGASILFPDVSALIATPVCAHTPYCKPIVFSDEKTAEISVNDDVNGCVYADGNFLSEIDKNNVLTVVKSNKPLLLIKNKRGFCKTLNKKLSGFNRL